MAKHKIHWQPEEWSELMKQARMIKEAEADITNQRLYLRAQLCLPPARRRPVTSGAVHKFCSLARGETLKRNGNKKFWIGDEWTLVAREAQRIRRDEDEWQQLSTIDLYKKAIENALPADRRGKFNTARQSKISALIKQLGPLPPKLAPPEAPPAEVNKPSVDNPFPNVPKRMPGEAAPAFDMNMVGAMVMTALGGFIEQAIVKFGAEIGKAVGKSMEEALYQMRMGLIAGRNPGAQEVAAPTPPAVVAAATAAAEADKRNGDLPEKFHKKKVMILGLLAGQQREIEARLKNEALIIRALSGDTPHRQIGAVADGSDACFYMTKFIGHSVMPHIHCKAFPVNGGINDLEAAIKARYPRTGAVAHA